MAEGGPPTDINIHVWGANADNWDLKEGEMITGLGRDRTFILTPLLGGIDPGFSWEGLHLFEREVWPHVRDLREA